MNSGASIITMLVAFFFSADVAMGFEKRNFIETTGGKDSVTSSSAVIPQQKKPALSFSGYFDTYYFGNFNNPSTRNNLGNSGISRGFDRYVGQFQLGMVMAHMGYAYKNVELITEIGWGPNIDYASYGSDFRYTYGTTIANSTYTAVFIKQAYINYKISEKFTLKNLLFDFMKI